MTTVGIVQPARRARQNNRIIIFPCRQVYNVIVAAANAHTHVGDASERTSETQTASEPRSQAVRVVGEREDDDDDDDGNNNADNRLCCSGDAAADDLRRRTTLVLNL